MKFVAQFLIVLITTNTSIVRGEKILDTINLTPENTTLTNTGRTLESNLKTVVKFANKAKFTEESALKLHLQNDGLEREVKEFTRNFVKNSSEQMPEELPNSLRNMNLAESNLVRIVLRNNSKQAEIKDIQEKLEIVEESSAYMEKLQNPLPVEKQNETSATSSQEGERTASQTLMRTITPIKETSDAQKDPNESLRSVVATQTSELVTKRNLDLLKIQEESKNSSDISNLELAPNLQLAKNNTAKQGDRGRIASALPRVEKINKYEISLLRSNLTEDKKIGNLIHTNKQEVKEDSLNNLQQFWNENPSQNINEYKIEPKPFNSNENTRNSILAQSELIEIILKEATNLHKKQAENNAILELNSTATSKSTSKTSNNFEKSSCNLTESALVQKSLKDETNSIQQGDRKDSSLLESTALNNNSNLNPILYINADGLQNYSAESITKMEEKFMNSSDSQVDKTTFPSEGTKLILQSLNSFMGVQTYNTTETKLESTSLNKLQEVKDLILTEFLEETAPTPDASNELTIKPLNSFKRHQNSNVTANEWKEEALNKVINLNTTQKENDLINKETITQLATSLVPANEINLKTLPNINVAQNESFETALEFVTNFDKPQEEKSLNFLEPVVKNVSSILAFIEMVTEPLNSFKGPKNYNQTEVELREAILEGFQNSNKTREQSNLNSFESLDQAASPPSAKELTSEPYNSFKEQQNYDKAESKMKEIVLKEFVNSNKMQRENNSDSLKSSAELTNTPIENLKLTHKPLNILKGPQSINGTENELEKTALKEIKNLNETQEAVNLNSLELLTKTNATSGTVNQLTPLTSFKENQNSTKSEQEPDHPEKLINFNIKQEKTNLSYKTSLVKSTSTTKAVIELNPEPLNKLNEPENSRATTKISMSIDNQQDKELLNAGQQSEEKKEYFAEPDTSSSSNDNEMDTDATPKSLITLEEYAVKQMNFILDHLLIETQEFVAKVLQATINSVFPRDHLKHYAEGVNRVLNPITESDYSDEIFESQTASQDEIYEQIIKKLNFLKSKPSKYLQKQIPPEWLDEFRDRRTELAIWLDKATEQMHKEFVYYITEEEDPIKYQYFNETFDDISRATEIHHKLALLADLVKIVKNKKQITFMDLYMQT